MNGISLIAAERRRQVEVEGWTPEHDDRHDRGELAQAAACYAGHPWMGLILSGIGARTIIESLWPWSRGWWKPTAGDRKRDLVKAGALIAAELDRLLRLDGVSTDDAAAPTGQAWERIAADERERCIAILEAEFAKLDQYDGCAFYVVEGTIAAIRALPAVPEAPEGGGE